MVEGTNSLSCLCFNTSKVTTENAACSPAMVAMYSSTGDFGGDGEGGLKCLNRTGLIQKLHANTRQRTWSQRHAHIRRIFDDDMGVEKLETD